MMLCGTALLNSSDSSRSDVTEVMNSDRPQSNVLSSHLIPTIDARRLLGVVFLFPSIDDAFPLL